MSIYDKTKMMCRTWIEAINNLFSMGKELEETVDGFKGGIIKDVTLTEVDKHYTLTILYDDDTSDTVTWDDSTVGIEDITMTYDDGVYLLTIILTDGTRYTFSIPVGNVVTEEELQSAVDSINATITAMNVGSPDDTASATGSLWARLKNVVTRIGILETADSNNVKKTGTSVVTGDIQVPTPAGDSSVISKGWANDISEGVNNLLHKSGNEYRFGTIYTQGNPIKHKLSIAFNERIINTDFFRIGTYDKNESALGEVGFTVRNNGTRDAVLFACAENGQTVIFTLKADNSGTPENPNITRYATLSNIRIDNLAQVRDNTTYNQDIVTIETLKKLGLI